MLYRHLAHAFREVVFTTDRDPSQFHWRPLTVDTDVVDSVQSSPTFHAIVDFGRTRIGRQVTGKLVKPAIGLATREISKVTWLKYTTKGVSRFLPIIGWGLLAYDLYNLGEDLELY